MFNQNNRQMKLTVYVMAFFLFAGLNSFGQAKPDKQFPIDSLYQVCLDSAKNQNTFGMISCATKARDSWEKEMEKYLTLLDELLEPKEKETLKRNQDVWLAYRNGELLLSGTLYGKLSDMKYRAEAFHRQAEIIRQRALDLKVYYEAVKTEKK
jgi:uncharacterized protein YecT (DUF1311 family)